MGLESMRIVTGCKTPEHFVSVFHRFVDAKHCFIPSTNTRPVGSQLAFSLRLADGTPMLRGSCVVKETFDTADNPFKRAGVHLEITKLTSDSEVVFEELLAHKTHITKVDGSVQAALHDDTNQHVPRDRALHMLFQQGNAIPKPVEETKTDKVDATPTVEMPPLHREESRAPGSAIVLPANPLSDFDDRAVDDLFAAAVSDDAEAVAIENELALPPPPKSREQIRTMLGFAPLRAAPSAIAHDDTIKMSAIPTPAREQGTAPLALPARAPAASPARTLIVHVMSSDERFWYLMALAAAVFAAGLVLAAAVFGG